MPPASALVRFVARWHPWLVAAACLSPFCGLLCPDGRVIPYDYELYQLPVRQFARDEILAGRFPLWLPYLGAGLPLHAGQQAALCHPILMPLVLAFGADYGLKLALFLHLALAYAGSYCLARAHGCSRPASSLAAVLVVWSGFLVNHLTVGHVALVAQFALLPWFFLLLAMLLRRPGPLPAAGLAVVTAGLALSGHPQLLYYALLFGGLWAAGSLGAGAARAAPLRCIGWGSTALGLSLAISSVQLRPAAELAGEAFDASERARQGFAGAYALTGLDVVRFAAPHVVGVPFSVPPPPTACGNYHERVVYLGLAVPILVLVGLSRATATRWQHGAAWLSLLSLAIALGDQTPVFAWMVECVPGLGWFRCPGRVFGVTTLWLALLAATGLDALLNGTARARGARGLPWIVLLFCTAGLAGYAVYQAFGTDDWPNYIEYARTYLVAEMVVWCLLAASTAAVLLFAAGWGRRCATLCHGAVLLLVFADLGWCNVALFKLNPRWAPTLPASLLAHGLPHRFVEVPIAANTSQPIDGASLSRKELCYSGLVRAAIDSRRCLLGTNEGGILPRATERLFDALQSNGQASLLLAGCDYLCSPVNGGGELLPGALPRLRFFLDAEQSLVAKPIEKVSADDVDRMRACMAGTVTLLGESPRKLVAIVEAPTAGRLVIADTWYAGWQASIDGAETPIDCAHGVFRCLPVPAGKHRIEMWYGPRSFRVGVLETLCGSLATGGLALFGLRNWRCRSAP